MNFVENDHSKMLVRAMDAYSLRQKVTAGNIANADTPGYKRHEVTFEDELLQAQQSGGAAAMKDTTPTIEVTDQNVILEDEMIEMTDTQLRVQLVTRSLRHHFDLMRTGITSINR